MNDCLFCKIIAGQIPSSKVYEDEYCYAFRDIAPQAPVHILVVSKEHVTDIADAGKLDDGAIAAIIRAIGLIATQEKLENGFRVVSNCGKDACQSVGHWHLHILAGKQMADQMA
ncbi:MAG: HIT domain-containing protein [Clostridiales bacterium]|nr:HIT domain-containing protein [Clostridiales bacterium]